PSCARAYLCMLFILSLRPPHCSPLFPYTTLFRSVHHQAPPLRPSLPVGLHVGGHKPFLHHDIAVQEDDELRPGRFDPPVAGRGADRKSTRLNSSHVKISYAVFCLKKKKT